MSFKVSGKVEVKKTFGTGPLIAKAIDKANAILANEIRNKAVLLIAKQGPGETQIRYGPKRQVTASAPGNPPNADTGRLMQSIKMERDGRSYLVGTNLDYGAYLEFGTQDMAARPWLSRALRIVERKRRQAYEIAYNNVVRGALK